MRILLPPHHVAPDQGPKSLSLGLLSQAWLSVCNCLWFSWSPDPWKRGHSLCLSFFPCALPSAPAPSAL